MIIEFTLPAALSVLLGGAVGAVARFLLDAYIRGGVLIANTVGSLLLGVMLGLSAGGSITWTNATLGLLATGLSGALTTYATVALRTAQLWVTKARVKAAAVWLNHTAWGLAAAVGGAWLGWALPI